MDSFDEIQAKTLLNYLESLVGKSKKEVNFFILPKLGDDKTIIVGFTDFAYEIIFVEIPKYHLKCDINDICLISNINDIKNFKNYILNDSKNDIKISYLKELVYGGLFCRERGNIPFFIDKEDLKNLNNFIKTKNKCVYGTQYLEFIEDKKEKKLILNAFYNDGFGNDGFDNKYKCNILKTAFSYKNYGVLNKKIIKSNILKEFKGSSLYIDCFKMNNRDLIVFSEYFKYGFVRRINILKDSDFCQNDYFDLDIKGYNINDYIILTGIFSLDKIDTKLAKDCIYSFRNIYKDKYALSIFTDDNKEAYIKVCNSKDDINYYICRYTGLMLVDIKDLNYDGLNIKNNFYINIKTFKEGF